MQLAVPGRSGCGNDVGDQHFSGRSVILIHHLGLQTQVCYAIQVCTAIIESSWQEFCVLIDNVNSFFFMDRSVNSKQAYFGDTLYWPVTVEICSEKVEGELFMKTKPIIFLQILIKVNMYWIPKLFQKYYKS